MWLLLTTAAVSTSHAALTGPCEGQHETLPSFCNVSLPVRARVLELLSELTVDEKLSLMGTDGASIPRLKIPQLRWGTECLHGVVKNDYADPAGAQPVHGPVAGGGATVFPQPLCTAASFDRALLGQIGEAIGTEARALNNAGMADGTADAAAFLSCWAPNINIFRDVRWGRGSETYGEDVELTSELAVAFVRGLQGNHSRYKRVIATPKHYTGYSVEEVDGISRTYFDSEIPMEDLSDTYLPAWEAVVTKGDVGSIMCSYNAINGTPSCGSKEFQTDVLRGRWQFGGFVVSDCGAVENIATAFHYNHTLAEASATAVAAGCDTECGGAYHHLNESLAAGMLEQSAVETALQRMLTQHFALGRFDPDPGSNPYRQIPRSAVGSTAHLNLAQQAAEAGAVLLKNVDKRLPLVGMPKVAVVGSAGNDSLVLLGNYHGAPFRNMVSTPFDAIVDKVGADRASFAPGAWPSGEGTWAFGDAIAAAASADVVLITVGSDSKGTLNGFTYYTTVEKESMDRKSIELPGMQLDLVKAIASQTKTPIICVLVHGGPLDISELIAMPRVEAVLSIGYPGQRGGVALANVLWGISPPSGRLTMTWPFANYTTQVSEASMAMRVWPGRTHRFIQVPVLFKFGFGLQYTEFEHSLVASPAGTADTPPDRWIAKCNVTNVGDTASAHVALLFGVPPANTGQNGRVSASVPRQVLLGFERLGVIEPNTSVHHAFDLLPRHWQLSDRSGVQQHTPGCWSLVLERASADLCV